MDRGETLVNCLAYIDLNPLRAGIAILPEKYRWNSIGYHLQTDNKDYFLSTDFGLKAFNIHIEKERIRRVPVRKIWTGKASVKFVKYHEQTGLCIRDRYCSIIFGDE